MSTCTVPPFPIWLKAANQWTCRLNVRVHFLGGYLGIMFWFLSFIWPLNLKHHCSNNWEQGKSTTSKRSASVISQGLVILYFPILFDVLTKQDDTGENTLNFDFFHLTCYSCGSLISFTLSWRWLFVQSL